MTVRIHACDSLIRWGLMFALCANVVPVYGEGLEFGSRYRKPEDLSFSVDHWVNGVEATNVRIDSKTVPYRYAQLASLERLLNDLMWGFAPPAADPSTPPKYREDDALQFIFDNILPILRP